MLWTWFRTTSKTKLRYRRFGYNQFSQTVKRGAKLYGTVRYIHVYCSVTRNSLYLFTAKWEEDSRECNGKKTKNTRGRFFDIKILARARVWCATRRIFYHIIRCIIIIIIWIAGIEKNTVEYVWKTCEKKKRFRPTSSFIIGSVKI